MWLTDLKGGWTTPSVLDDISIVEKPGLAFDLVDFARRVEKPWCLCYLTKPQSVLERRRRRTDWTDLRELLTRGRALACLSRWSNDQGFFNLRNLFSDVGFRCMIFTYFLSPGCKLNPTMMDQIQFRRR